MEVESALVSHDAVSEAAVVGRPDALKGQAVVALVVLRQGLERKPGLVDELRAHVRTEIGPVATPADLYLVDRLPKTRSGKIMRRVLRAVVSESQIGDVTTLEDPSAVEEVRAWLRRVKEAGPQGGGGGAS
jgi:acetyl-CoA synthetase